MEVGIKFGIRIHGRSGEFLNVRGGIAGDADKGAAGKNLEDKIGIGQVLFDLVRRGQSIFADGAKGLDRLAAKSGLGEQVGQGAIACFRSTAAGVRIQQSRRGARSSLSITFL